MIFLHVCVFFICPFLPQDAEVANMYKINRDTYNQTAKFWTETYAQVYIYIFMYNVFYTLLSLFYMLLVIVVVVLFYVL